MRTIDTAGLTQHDLIVGVLLGEVPVTVKAGHHVTRPLLLIHVLEVVKSAECLVLPVCVLDREIYAHPLQLLHDLGPVVTVGTFEVFLPTRGCVFLYTVPVEVSATAGNLEALVLREVLLHLLVTDHTVAVRGGRELASQLPLSVCLAVNPHVVIELERGPNLHSAREVGGHLAVFPAAAENKES